MTRTLTLSNGERTVDIQVTDVRYGPAPNVRTAPTNRASAMEAIDATIKAIFDSPPLMPDPLPLSRAQYDLMNRLNARLKQGTQ